eukprot:10816-Pelagococcus_subviridis.AAC.6
MPGDEAFTVLLLALRAADHPRRAEDGPLGRVLQEDAEEVFFVDLVVVGEIPDVAPRFEAFLLVEEHEVAPYPRSVRALLEVVHVIPRHRVPRPHGEAAVQRAVRANELRESLLQQDRPQLAAVRVHEHRLFRPSLDWNAIVHGDGDPLPDATVPQSHVVLPDVVVFTLAEDFSNRARVFREARETGDEPTVPERALT